MASIFLDCFKNTGKDYIRIVEGYYFKKPDGKATVKRRTIKNLGPLSNFDDNLGEGLLIRLREKFKSQELNIGMSYDKLNLPELKPKIKNLEKHLNLKNMGYFFLDNIFNKLGISEMLIKYKSDSKIKYDLNGLVKILVFGRILNPKSKKATFKDRNKYLFPVTSSNKETEIYKSLDVLDKKSKAIQRRMNTRIKNSTIGRNTDITYYDVTNYWFETMYGDDDVFELDEEGNKILDEKGKTIILEKGLRKKGVCKNNTPNPIVAMGLFIDNNGIPISYDLFPGNTQDKTTFKEIIKESIISKTDNKVIVVADNGIYAQENMYLIVTNNNGYIISKSVKKHWTTKVTKEEENQGISTLKDWALDDNDYVFSYNQDGTVRSKTKSRTYNRTLKDSNGNTIVIKEKQVLFWNEKHYKKEYYQNKKFIEYLESCKENPDKLKDKQRKSQEFVKVVQTDKKTGEVIKTKPLVILLEDKIEKYKETMGFYSIITSEIEMEDAKVKQRYHGLSRIEDSFRIIKSDLEGRPIYVWIKEHINAHFLICFIALTIIRIMQHKVLKYQNKNTLNGNGWEAGITAEKIKESLNKYEANHIGDGYYQTAEEDETIKLIKKSINLKENDLDFPSLNKLNSYKTTIASQKL